MKQTQLTCGQCGKYFTRIPYLTIHNRAHTRGKPYKFNDLHNRLARRRFFADHTDNYSDVLDNEKIKYLCPNGLVLQGGTLLVLLQQSDTPCAGTYARDRWSLYKTSLNSKQSTSQPRCMRYWLTSWAESVMLITKLARCQFNNFEERESRVQVDM